MSYKTPKDIAKAGILTGATKAKLSWDKALVAGFLAGAYIAIAGLLAIVVSSGMPKEWGGLPTFITGAVFSVVTTPDTLERTAAIAHKKGLEESEWQIFTRAVGCNWLVCLGVWMALAAEDVAGKILAIFFPIMAFVALGFDHVVANMFFLPVAIFAGVDGIGWTDALHNWAFAFLGNMVGATVFVSASYWYLYAREVQEEPGDTPSGAPARERTPEAVR